MNHLDYSPGVRVEKCFAEPYSTLFEHYPLALLEHYSSTIRRSRIRSVSLIAWFLRSVAAAAPGESADGTVVLCIAVHHNEPPVMVPQVCRNSAIRLANAPQEVLMEARSPIFGVPPAVRAAS